MRVLALIGLFILAFNSLVITVLFVGQCWQRRKIREAMLKLATPRPGKVILFNQVRAANEPMRDE